MAKQRTNAATVGPVYRPTLARTTSGGDRTFGQALKTKSIERIIPEAVNRFEAGRRLWTKDATTAAEAELELLAEERKRLEGGDGGSAAGRERIERLIAAVTADVAAGHMTLAAIERAVVPQPGGWTVIGRVLRRDNRVPDKAEVLFIDEHGKPVDELGVQTPAEDGGVRVAYPPEVVKRLAEQGMRIVAAVRIHGRIVAADDAPVRIGPGRVHQFDLRVENGLVG